MIEHIGDIIVSTPFLHALRQSQPTAHLTVVISKNASPLLERCPLIDNLIVAENRASLFSQLTCAFKLGLRLRTLKHDIAIVPKDAPNEDFNELICLLAGCRRRISRVRPQLAYRIKPLKLAPFYDCIVIDDQVRHEADQRRRLAQLFGGSASPAQLKVWLSPEDHDYATRFFDEIDAKRSNVLISLGIGASAAGRCWPLENFACVIESLVQNYDITVVAIIGPSEIESAKELKRLTKHPIHYAAGATVRQSIALMQRSALFIGNDSGPMHMAASVGVPVVEISAHPQGATPWSINSPERFGAYGVPMRIVRPAPKEPRCRNGCMSGFAPHCITNITPDTVIEAARDLLKLSITEGMRKYGANQDLS